MSTGFQHLFSLMCDDIREELGNKLSLIGVYSPDIIVGGLPTVMPKLCFYIRVTGGGGQINFSISLTDPSGEGMVRGSGSFTVPERIPKSSPGAIPVVLAGVPLRLEGIHRFELVLEGDPQPLCVLEFNVVSRPEVFK